MLTLEWPSNFIDLQREWTWQPSTQGECFEDVTRIQLVGLLHEAIINGSWKKSWAVDGRSSSHESEQGCNELP